MRSFTDHFKAGAIRLVLDESRTVTQVARDLDLIASARRRWSGRWPVEAKPKPASPPDQRAELARLRKAGTLATASPTFLLFSEEVGLGYANGSEPRPDPTVALIAAQSAHLSVLLLRPRELVVG